MVPYNNIISLVQTSVKGNVYLLLLGRLQDCMCKEVASSKKYEIIQDYSAKIGTLFITTMTIIDTVFMTKMAEKPYLWGRTYLYSPYKGVTPPGLHVPSKGPFTQAIFVAATHCNSMQFLSPRSCKQLRFHCDFSAICQCKRQYKCIA